MNPQLNSNVKKGWFSRNWKWFVPVGCLSMILLIAVFATAIIFIAFGAIKSSDIYQQAITKTQSNATVIKELGEPIKPGWLVSGSININNESGNADFSIPVSGPRKSGTVHAIALKKEGKWGFSTLEVKVEGESQSINLLAPSNE